MPKRASSVPGAAGGPAKRKHVTLSIKDKVTLIKKLESGTSVAKLCEEYGLGKSTVYDIKKQKKELFDFFVDSDTPIAMSQRKIISHAKSDDHDKVMIEWIRQRRSEGVPLSGPLVIEQAKLFHTSMNLTTDCTYSVGWLNKFKQRHGLRHLKISGERASADTEAAENFVSEFLTLVEEENLSPEQVYNGDETGLFWRYVPRNTLATAEEKNPTGIKDSKERITILACGNAAGTHKNKLFVIGKSAKPRAFKGVKVFPVIYRANKRAWMTQTLMNDWFENHFVPEARRHLSSVGFPVDAKIVLILDNCTAHLSPELLVKDNVSVLFLPPNCTSILQPMDMGILRAFKCHYKSNFLREMLGFLNGGETIQEFSKSYNLKMAVWNAAKSWDAMPTTTLKNAWHNLWPATIFSDDGDDDKENDFEGFRISNEKREIMDLLEYVKTSRLQIAEEDILEVFHCDDEAPTVCQLTDEEIHDMVMKPGTSTVSSESEESEGEVEDKIPIDNLLETLNTAIKGLEQRDFISEIEIMAMHKIREKLIAQKPKLLKQLTLKQMFFKRK